MKHFRIRLLTRRFRHEGETTMGPGLTHVLSRSTLLVSLNSLAQTTAEPTRLTRERTLVSANQIWSPPGLNSKLKGSSSDLCRPLAHRRVQLIGNRRSPSSPRTRSSC